MQQPVKFWHWYTVTAA